MKFIFRSVCLSICLLVLNLSIHGQELQTSWVNTVGSSGVDEVKDMVVDSAGNVFVVGNFSGTADFAPGPGTFLVSAASTLNGYLAKYNPQGGLVWVAPVLSSGNSEALGIGLAPNGDVIITGVFNGNCDFDPGIPNVSLSASGSGNAFVVRYTTNASVVWARLIESNTTSHGLRLQVSASGSVYVCGYFNGTADFDPSGATVNLTSQGFDAYVLKLDAMGNYNWVRRIGASNVQVAQDLALDNLGNVYTAGYFNGMVDMNPGTGVFNLSSGGSGFNGFVQAMDSLGQFRWAVPCSSANNVLANAITTDANANVYVTGSFVGNTFFNGSMLFGPNVAGNATEVFLWKIDSTGGTVALKGIGGVHSESGTDVKVQSDGYIILMGIFGFESEFNTGAGYAIRTYGNTDVFMAMINQNMVTQFVSNVGGTGEDYGAAIDIHRPSKSIFAAGSVTGGAPDFDFDFNYGNSNLSTIGNKDSYIHRIDYCSGITNVITASACGSFTFNGNTYTNSGNYGFMRTSFNGCDSIVQLQLTILSGATINVAPANQTDVSCFGLSDGAASIQAPTGGTGPYTYDWTGNPTGDGSQSVTGLTAGSWTCTVTDANGCSGSYTFTINQPQPLNAFPSSSFPDCNGGTNGNAGVTVFGGTGPFTYAWSPGNPQGDGTNFIFGLGAGSYSCLVVDAKNCSTTALVDVLEPALIGTTVNPIICAGQTYTNSGNSFTTAGVYNFNLPAYNGCDSVITVNLQVLPAASRTQSLTICAGQTVTVGTSVYSTQGTYTDIFTAFNGCDSVVTTQLTVNNPVLRTESVNICAGQTYTVGGNTYASNGTYTNTLTGFNGCDSTITTNLTVLPINTQTNSVTICNGDSYTVGSSVYTTSGSFTDILTGANGCDSIITTQLTVLPANTQTNTITICNGESVTVGSSVYNTSGVYTDTFAASNGCDSVIITDLTVNPLPVVTVTLAGATFTATGSADTYQWIDCNNSGQIINGETTNSFTASVNGSYGVITSLNGCVDTSNCVDLTSLTALDEPTLNWIVYPNPAQQFIRISSELSFSNLVIMDMLGRVKISQNVSNVNSWDVAVAQWPAGTYLVRIYTTSGWSVKQFIVVNP